MQNQNLSVEKQLEVIKRGAAEVISEEELKRKLVASKEKNRPLTVKAGFDPTAPDLHLGHTVLLRKLRQFQDLGHRVVFLIGDFTGRIGDPSGRSELRKQLTREEVLRNARTYTQQVSKILDLGRLEIRFNSEWFEKMSVLEILRLTTHATVSQMLAREDFRKRMAKNEEISLLEFMYPILQGYDSVVLEADIELGGTDQIFNLLVGRDIQKDFRQEPQVVLTMPLLEGLDGVQKMSKSYNNYIGISEAPSEMFGKAMSISDDMMLKYYTLLTDEDLQEVKGLHPKEAKMRLAFDIVRQYHGEEAADKARLEFERVFSRKETPQDIPEYRLAGTPTIVTVLVESGLAKSGNEARRLIRQGAVFFEGLKVETEDFVLPGGGIIRAGTRRFLRVVT